MDMNFLSASSPQSQNGSTTPTYQFAQDNNITSLLSNGIAGSVENPQHFPTFEGSMAENNNFTEQDIQELIDNISLKEVLEPAASPIGFDIDDHDSPYKGQWAKIEELAKSSNPTIKTQINNLFAEMSESFFNYTFRKTFAEFIESKSWDRISLNQDDGDSIRMARTIITQMQKEVSSRMNQSDFMRFELEKWYTMLGEMYYFPLEFVSYIQKTLHQEHSIILYAQNQQHQMFPEQKAEVNVEASSATAFVRTSEISQELTELERLCQQSTIGIQELTREVQTLLVFTGNNLTALDHYSVEQFSQEQQLKVRELRNKRDLVKTEEDNHVQQFHIKTYDRLHTTVRKVLDEELRNWQRNEAYVNMGRKIPTVCDIKHLEQWMKRLAKLTNSLLFQISEIIRLEMQLGIVRPPMPSHQVNVCEYLRQKYGDILRELVQKGLVVEKQPPQVLMKDKRFACQLRHLISDGLDIHQVPFEVDAYLVNAEQASKVLREGPMSQFTATGKIVNSSARSDFIDHLRQLSVNMRNMCLKMQQRGAARNAEMVAELKFGMLFRTTIALRLPPNTTTNVVAETMSLPIVVISHGKQEADAQATIFWDNAFSKIGRNPFEIDDSVPWSYMLESLNARWCKEVEEGGRSVGLSEQSREYLTMKLFNEKRVPKNTMISWKRFNHDKLLQCGPTDARRELFTFWTWFFKAMELVSSPYVKKYWNAGAIHGFLSKADCQRMLSEANLPGVFLFRFSETKLGAVSISCYAYFSETQQNQVSHLEPDTIKNFHVRSLADMVKDLNYLEYLYPNKAKDTVFGAHYTAPVTTNNSTIYVPKTPVIQTVHIGRTLDPAFMSSPSPRVVMKTEDEEMLEDHK